MNMPSQPEQPSSVEAALYSAAQRGDPTSALTAVAHAQVYLPQGDQEAPDAGGEPATVSLLVLEQEGRLFVPTFTSETKLVTALPDMARYLVVDAATLGANWPSDDLWMLINPGSDESLSLDPEMVKTLPALAVA